jgi:predicted AlkP superfamily pyrophosphatase or phosphodiesterase
MRRASLLLLLLAGPALARPPRLTLFIAVDGLGSEVFLRNRPHYRAGFARLLAEGATFPVVRYQLAECVTAAGHATLATGAWPWRHGAVGNRFFDRAAGKLVPMFFDPGHPVLEAPAAIEDSSPLALQAETVSDRLRAATGLKGKSVTLSGKGRSAVALAGRLGDAWWFHEQVGKFVTGTWYRKEVPAWVKAFNDRHLPDAYQGKSWELALPAKEYQGEDDRPFESEPDGLGRTFPHPLGGGAAQPGPAAWAALASTPMLDDVLVELAKAALEGEQLGKDDVPDLLQVSFSPLDRTYHLWGPSSWEMQDHLVRLDRALGELIAAAERAAGRGNLLVVLSSDHGGAEVPEAWAAMGLDGVRVPLAGMQKAVGDELEHRFGAPGLVAALEGIDLYLDGKVLEGHKLDGPAVRRAAAAFLARQPDVQLAVAREDLPALDAAGLGPAVRHSVFGDRSGDVLVVLKPFRVLQSETRGTSHGTPWSYDAEVPLLLLGRGVKPGQYLVPASAVDVAPTLSALLELGSPAMCEGTALGEALVAPR